MFNVFELSFINKKRRDKRLVSLSKSPSASFRGSTSFFDDRVTVNDAKARSKLPFLLTPLSMAMFLTASPVNAACKNNDCVCKPSQLQFASPTAELNDEGQFPIVLEADDLAVEDDEVVTLTGNAEVSQGRQTIVADKLQYYRESERVIAQGNVELISPNGDYISADSVDVVTSSSIGSLENAQFKLAKGIQSKDGVDTVKIDSRGSADKVSLEGEGFIRLEGARYTNCHEGDDSVVVTAKELELDQLTGIGKARNAVVRFQGIPIFYTPYLSFPINDKRKTGFLTPSFGSDEESGVVLEFPWYWNISKNQDATITPRFYSDRGIQLGAEYRRQTQSSSTFIYGEVLPDDDLFGDDRELIQIKHTQQFTQNLSARLNYNDVSDSDYFEDLSNDIRLFSATFIPRDLTVNYTHDLFDFNVRFSQFELIDSDLESTVEPLERLPEINFNTRFDRLDNGIQFGVDWSYTNFQSETGVEGERLVASPYIEQVFESSWGYIKPALSVNYRAFELDDLDEGENGDPSFTVPALSIDSALYFEKDINWFGNDAVQTLEPRLFYAYAPDEDQSDVPLFDTSTVNFNNYDNIFRVNRFFGQDRFADTNQLTLGLTSRVLDQQTGLERIKASFGQVYYIDDLEQSLFSEDGVEEGFGDFLFELRTQGNSPWSTYSFIQYDHNEDELRTARFDLAYAPRDDNRKRVSLGYFTSDLDDRDDVDQVTFNLDWPLSDRWQFRAQERYSIEDSASLFRDVGVEYNACCWKVRFRAQDRITNRTVDDSRTSFFIELELTALGTIRSGL